MQRITLLIACILAVSFPVESSNIQLVNGDHSCSGRVEIYHAGKWGTVCDDGWDINDAEVVCKQLGCGSAVTAFPAAHFGEGSGPIWLSNLHCSGSESSITKCLHNGFGSHNCFHYEDAGVECSVPDDSLSVIPKIRLVNGDHLCSGRVEISYAGQWGTVCDNGWDINDAEVVCKEIGCGGAITAFGSAHFGEGSDPIWLSNVDCYGSESSITQCPHDVFGSHDCSHVEDAGVECSVSLQPYFTSLGVALRLLLILLLVIIWYVKKQKPQQEDDTPLVTETSEEEEENKMDDGGC